MDLAASDAAVLAAELIVALGGTTVSADTAGSEAIPVDVSFGDWHPLLPVAPRLSVARMLLERYLPGFARDAQRAVELADQTARLAEDAAIDALTGLVNKRFLGRALGRLRAGDTVIMLDLDHFKDVNDRLGHLEGDRVLRVLGCTLASTLRATELPMNQQPRFSTTESGQFVAFSEPYSPRSTAGSALSMPGRGSAPACVGRPDRPVQVDHGVLVGRP